MSADKMPPELARMLIEGAREYYAAPEGPQRAEVAVRYLHVIREHMRGKVRLMDVEALFAGINKEGIGGTPRKPPTRRKR